jgi:hypothetical protein
MKVNRIGKAGSIKGQTEYISDEEMSVESVDVDVGARCR